MRRASSVRPDSISSADCLPSIARLSSDSSTGSRDCASSRVKVFMGTVYSEQWSVNSGQWSDRLFACGYVCQGISPRFVADRSKQNCSLFTVHCFSHFQHAVQRDFGPALDAGTDLYAVDDAALDQVFQSPGQVVGTDAVHGGAEAAGVVQRDDLFTFGGKALGHAVDEVNLRADGEHCARGSLLDEGDQLLGGAERVGLLADLEAALGVNNDLDAGVAGAHLIDVAGQEALMDGAVAQIARA